MKYRLKSDLSKTRVYMVVKQFAPSGITLPSVRQCEFKKYRGSYWMYFCFDGHKFKADFDVCLGRAYVSYELVECNTDSVTASVCESFRRQVVNLTPDYLLGNQLLREVS